VSESTLVAEATKALFDAREQFLVVGLTGRTGSGCSSVAGLLAAKTPQHALRPVARTFVHELRKDRIVGNWIEKHWHPFARISVSDVITAFALEEGESFVAYADSVVGPESLGECVGLIEEWSRAAKQHAQTLTGLTTCADDAVRAAYKFYFVELPAYAQKVKLAITSVKKGGYTTLFQQLGDSLRKSGRAFSDEETPENLFAIVRRIHAIVELGCRYNKLDNVKHDYFVVDALRHPYEILFLREKVSRFYAVAITTDEASRRSRLHDGPLNLGGAEIAALDAKEYPREQPAQEARSKPKARALGQKYNELVSQNIQDCISLADVYLTNLGMWAANPDLGLVAKNIYRYVALMQHPGLVTPTPVERCMQAAWAARLNSGCISRQVGAVVTDENYSIKAVGWNDAPRGQVPCSLRYAHDLLHGDNSAFSKYEQSDQTFREKLLDDEWVAAGVEHVGGRHITYCFKSVYNKVTGDKNQVHTRALHAEENAFLQIVKSGGQGVEGGILFTTSSPCELCAKKAYQLGLSTVYYVDPYPGISNSHVFGVGEPPAQVLFSGVIGRAYHDLFEPLMPYKEELNMLQPNRQAALFELPRAADGAPSDAPTGGKSSRPTGGRRKTH
jgi:deoxycytidylate deaminase